MLLTYKTSEHSPRHLGFLAAYEGMKKIINNPLCSRNFQNVKLRLYFADLIILPPLQFYGEFKGSKNVIFGNFTCSEF